MKKLAVVLIGGLMLVPAAATPAIVAACRARALCAALDIASAGSSRPTSAIHFDRGLSLHAFRHDVGQGRPFRL